MSLNGPDHRQSKLIREEINELGLGKLEDNLKLLRDWIDSQPHLPKDYDERMLPVFLRGCKHNLERTKAKIDTYFTVRGTMNEFFGSRDPLGHDIQEASKQMTVTPLPNLTPEGYRVTIHRFTGASVADFNAAALYKMIIMKADIRIVEETLIAGDIFVFDLTHLSVMLITKLAHPLIKSVLYCAQEAFPQRLKEIHLINAPPFVDKALNIYKMFLKEKMRNRMQIHTGYKTLHSIMPPLLLPSDYEGQEKSIEALEGEWRKKLESYSDWFAKQNSVVSNEQRRLSKKASSQSTDNIFGYEGAFRKLAID